MILLQAIQAYVTNHLPALLKDDFSDVGQVKIYKHYLEAIVFSCLNAQGLFQPGEIPDPGTALELSLIHIFSHLGQISKKVAARHLAGILPVSSHPNGRHPCRSLFGAAAGRNPASGEEKPMTEKIRCSWANPKNPLYIRYHDEEWGVPVHDDHKLFEMLILESFQAGLSWECILNKREAFRQAFDGFDPVSYTHLGHPGCGDRMDDLQHGAKRSRDSVRRSNLPR